VGGTEVLTHGRDKSAPHLVTRKKSKGTQNIQCTNNQRDVDTEAETDPPYKKQCQTRVAN